MKPDANSAIYRTKVSTTLGQARTFVLHLLNPTDRRAPPAEAPSSGAHIGPSIRVATEQAEAVVALAGFNIGETLWRRMTGYLVAVDDRIQVLAGFEAVRADAQNAFGGLHTLLWTAAKAVSGAKAA